METISSTLIDVANKWEDGDLKNALIMVIANHMKKSYLSWNKDTVKDEVIFEHLYELSGGTIEPAENRRRAFQFHRFNAGEQKAVEQNAIQQ